MASPNATGSAILLVDCFDSLFPGCAMRASTLKALIMHTADDMGNPGPDYAYGWELMNAKAAADLVTDCHASPRNRKIVEGRLDSANPADTHTISWDDASAIRVTLCWTDPPGEATDLDVARCYTVLGDPAAHLVGR